MRGSASPKPRTSGTSGRESRSRAAIPGPGSTATTSALRSRSSRVAIPVPAPTSTTREPRSGRPVAASIVSKRAGG